MFLSISVQYKGNAHISSLLFRLYETTYDLMHKAIDLIFTNIITKSFRFYKVNLTTGKNNSVYNSIQDRGITQVVVAGFRQLRPTFHPRSDHVGFLEVNIALG